MACSKARRKKTPQLTATAKKFTYGKVEAVAEPGDVSGIYKSCSVRLCCSYTSDLGELSVAFASKLKKCISLFLQLDMTFGRELVDLHRAPSMLCKFWCMLGGSLEV